MGVIIHWMMRAVTRGCRSEVRSVLKNVEGVIAGGKEMRASVRVVILSWSINVLSRLSGKKECRRDTKVGEDLSGEMGY